MAPREYSLLAPGMSEAPSGDYGPCSYYEQHAESVELWSPGNPLFQGSGVRDATEEKEELPDGNDVESGSG